MCTICGHPQREAIDRAIMAGDSCRKIGTMFVTSRMEVHRHKTICMKRNFSALPAPIAPPAYKTTAEVITAKQTSITVLHRVSSLIDVLEKQAQECVSDADWRNMNGTAVALLKALELNARLTGELLPGNQTAVQVNVGTPSLTAFPEWRIFVRVIERHPEIKDELSKELQEGGF